MADDARLAELRGLMAETLRAVQAAGTWAPEDAANALLPVVEQHAARRAAEELGEALGKAATLGPLEAVAWMARRHAALTPATEEER